VCGGKACPKAHLLAVVGHNLGYMILQTSELRCRNPQVPPSTVSGTDLQQPLTVMCLQRFPADLSRLWRVQNYLRAHTLQSSAHLR
jgi:hypothetical protein